MKFVIAFLVVTAAGSTSCEDLCASVASCHSSHCETNGVCFGLYWRRDGQLCDFPSDSTCPQTAPVSCPSVIISTEGPTNPDALILAADISSPPTTTLSASVVIPLNQCDRLCHQVPGCKQTGKGSYCKTWGSPPVCFGLAWTSDAKTVACFIGSPGCSDSHPVLCTDVGESTSTTETPTTVVASTVV